MSGHTPFLYVWYSPCDMAPSCFLFRPVQWSSGHLARTGQSWLKPVDVGLHTKNHWPGQRNWLLAFPCTLTLVQLLFAQVMHSPMVASIIPVYPQGTDLGLLPLTNKPLKTATLWMDSLLRSGAHSWIWVRAFELGLVNLWPGAEHKGEGQHGAGSERLPRPFWILHLQKWVTGCNGF